MRRASGTPRERMPTSATPVDAAVALENLVRDARERAGHAVGIHHDRHGATSGRAWLSMSVRSLRTRRVRA